MGIQKGKPGKFVKIFLIIFWLLEICIITVIYSIHCCISHVWLQLCVIVLYCIFMVGLFAVITINHAHDSIQAIHAVKSVISFQDYSTCG